MPNVIRTSLAAAASFGLLALIPASAQAATVIDPLTALTPTASAAAPAAPAATTAPAPTAAPTSHPMTMHERKLLQAHRRAVLLHRRVVARNHVVARALTVANRQQGDPYMYGGTGPSAFDCSGLMLYSFRAAGIHLPRTAEAQAGAVRRIPRSQMRPGDLVFFTSGAHVYHVGMFEGWRHGQRIIVHAPYPGATVRTEAIWTDSWFAGTERIKH